MWAQIQLKIAIVGTTVTLTENEERDIRQFIGLTLHRYNSTKDTIISGGAKGVDTMAIEIAKGQYFKTEIYDATLPEWKYYKERNLLIAKNCDELYCISVPVHKIQCYHHDGLQDHEKTAACWTMKKALELHKVCQLMVIQPR